MKEARRFGKRLLVYMLTLAMLLTFVPMTAFAAESEEDVYASETVTEDGDGQDVIDEEGDGEDTDITDEEGDSGDEQDIIGEEGEGDDQDVEREIDVIELEVEKYLSGDDMYYQFVPEENGEYTFSLSEMSESEGNINVRNSEFEYYTDGWFWDTESETSLYLDGGETYYITFTGSDGSTPVSGSVVITKCYDIRFHCNIDMDKAWVEEYDEETGDNVKVESYTKSWKKGSTLYDKDEGSVGFDFYTNGVSFLGWSTVEGATEPSTEPIIVTGDMDLYAVWKLDKAVTLDANGGYFWEPERTQIVEYYDPDEYVNGYSEPQNPDETKEFMGFATSKDATESDISETLVKDLPDTLYAVWADTCEVTFDVNRADASEASFYDEENATSITQYTRRIAQGSKIDTTNEWAAGCELNYNEDNMRFAGWSEDPNATTPDETITVKKKTTLYAVWKKTYTVTFDANGGEPLSYINDDETGEEIPQTSVKSYYAEGEKLGSYSVSHSDPLMAFAGWYDTLNATGGTRYDRTYAVDKDLTLYARWIALTPAEISVGDIVEAKSDDTNKVLFEFTPQEDGYYVINSADAKNNHPLVTLYDSEENELASDQYGGVNSNFLLTYELKAGKTYRYLIKNGKTGAFEYSVKLEKATPVTLTFNANRDDAVVGESEDIGTATQKSISKVAPAGMYYPMYSIEAKAADESMKFAGWSEDPDATSGFNGDLVPEDDTTYYAVWKKAATVTLYTNAENASFTEKFVDEDPTTTSITREVYAGESLDFWDCDIYYGPEGKYFAGWSTDPNATEPDDTIIAKEGENALYAVWKDREQTPVEEKIPAKLTLHINRTDGLTFDNGKDTMQVNSYVNSWYYGIECDCYSDRTLQFAGWSEDPNATTGEEDIRITGDMDLYAIWTPQVKVTFNANHADVGYENWDDEGENDLVQTTYGYYKKGSTLDLYINEPDRGSNGFGLAFLGWSKDPNAEKADDEIVLDQDTTVYAVWGECSYITFSANGGYFPGEGIIITEQYISEDNDLYIYCTPSYAKGGKVFAGWATTPDATEPNVTLYDTRVGDIIAENGGKLYAVWKTICTVTYDVNGGEPFKIMDNLSDTDTEQFREGERFISRYVSHADPFKAFEGWYDAKEGGTKYDASSRINSDVTLYAHWKDLNVEKAAADTNLIAAASDVNQVLYEFTPDEDGLYIINSADARGFYPSVVLYDKDKNIIGQANKWYTLTNFRFFAELKGGQKYYYLITNAKDGAFSYKARIEKVAAKTVTFDANLPNAIVTKTDSSDVAGTASGSKVCQVPAPIGYIFETSWMTAESDSDNYRFAGWSSDPNAIEANNNWFLVSDTMEDQTFYGVWKETAKITFHMNNEDAHFTDVAPGISTAQEVEQTFDIGENIADVSPNRFSCDWANHSDKYLIGWAKTADADAPEQSIIVSNEVTDLYAVWSDLEVTDETLAAAKTIKTGDTLDASANFEAWFKFQPTEDGYYEFTSSDNSTANGDRYDVYAQLYNDDKEQFASNDNGNGDGNFSLCQELKAGETYYYKVQLLGDDGKFSCKVSLDKVETGTLVLHVNHDNAFFGLTGNDTLEVVGKAGSTYVLGEDISREGTDGHVGWSEDMNATAGEWSAVIKGGETTHLYAVWKPAVTATLHVNRDNETDAYFDVWDDSGLRKFIPSQSMTEIFVKGDSVEDMTYGMRIVNSDLKFLGWSTNKNATTPDKNIVLDGDTDLYAVWAQKEFVTYVANGGYFENVGVIYTQSYIDKDAVISPKYEPANTDPSKEFLGWATTSDAVIPNADGLTVSEANVLYAVYGEKVEPVDISGATIGGITNKTYNGKEQTQDLTVTLPNGTQLTEGVDYNINYSNNVNAGKATMIIAGRRDHNYTGTITAEFTINKANSTISLKGRTATYTGKTIAMHAATCTGSTGKVTYTYYVDKACKTKTTKSKNGSASDGYAPKNAGTYYVKATVAADANYNGKTSAAAKLVINKATHPKWTVKQSGAKNVKLSNVKKKAQIVSGAFKITGKKGTTTYAKVAKGSSKYLTINKTTGKITVKKGTPKGKQVINVKVTDTSKNYKTASKTVKITITVK